MLRAFRFLFQLRREHYYEALPLPPLGNLHDRARQLELPQYPHVMGIVNFILGSRPHHSTRALCRPPA